jgi:hypothetical protein
VRPPGQAADDADEGDVLGGVVRARPAGDQQRVDRPAQAGQIRRPGELEAARQGQRAAAHRGHRDPVGRRAAGLGGQGVGQGEDVAGAGQLHTEDVPVADDDDLADHGDETRARDPCPQ